MNTNKSLRQVILQLIRQVNCKDCGDGGGGIGVETDPIFTASPAANITNIDLTFIQGKDYNSLNNKPNLSLKADLVGGVVPASQLPSYVDDVLEFTNLAAFPATGEQGKLYVALDTNKIYRWSGSAYIDMTPGEADTLQTVVTRGNSTTKPIIFQPSEGRAGELNFNPTTYSLWFGNMNLAHTGTFNIGIGANTLNKLTTGESNIVIGGYSGSEITTADWNTIIGITSGSKLTTAAYNVFVGNESGKNTTNANSNTFIGDETGVLNTTGFKNTYLGTGAGYNSTTGKLNTALGYKSALASNLGDLNTAVGAFSAQGVTGRNNVLIGVGAGNQDGAINNKLIIHSNNTLNGYTNEVEGNFSSFQQSQLARGLITGDFVDRWVRINGYMVVGSTGNNTADISLIPGQGIKSTVYYAPTLATDYVQKQYVDAIKPYKSYVCLIQSGGTPTPSPSFVELENTIGAIVWTRNDVGEYFGTLTGAFPSNKVVCFAQLGTGNGGVGPNKNIITARLDNDRVFLKVTNEDGSATPFEFTGQIGSLEIRVYN